MNEINKIGYELAEEEREEKKNNNTLVVLRHDIDRQRIFASSMNAQKADVVIVYL